jgi:hypothetical protein
MGAVRLPGDVLTGRVKDYNDNDLNGIAAQCALSPALPAAGLEGKKAIDRYGI